MRRWMLVSLVVAAFLPMMFVAWLFAAAKVPALDRFTLAMPIGLREAVAQMAIGDVKTGKKDADKAIDRVIRLNPDDMGAWNMRCSAEVGKTAASALTTCRRALQLNYTENNLNNVGLAQEAAKDFCGAEESFTQANSMENARDSSILRSMGRAALLCGHPAASVASFEVAEETDTKADDDDENKDLTLDREWQVVANLANKSGPGASAACTKAHPEWKSCACTVVEYKVKCSEGR